MKRLKPFMFVAALVSVLLTTSFTFDRGYYDDSRYGGYEPFFMERSELEKSVKYAAQVRDMEEPGKIWVSGDGGRIYVVERYKGVHIVDNSDPEHPVQTKFIIAPGCMDVAVKENIVYLDNAVDLVAFDLTTGNETERIENYFPEPASPNGEYFYNDSGMILAGWKKIEK